jgi:hypothetical protein
MNTYLKNLQKGTNKKLTENGADTLLSTMNPLVDFFAMGGATRDNPALGLDLFKKAFSFDNQKAIRILFYLRDIRGGQGERELFRNCLAYLGKSEKETAKKIVEYIPEYGRYDDMFSLPVDMFTPFIMEQISKDWKSDTPSLLAKWLPSENTSSKKTVSLAREIRSKLGATSKEYRKTLSTLREKIKLVEHNLTNKDYDSINYEIIPSQASLKYKKAFYRNDEVNYKAYIESVKKGEKKINASTLYPYQIYENVGDDTAEALWGALPDYTQGNNAIVVADVSGSMSGRPMSVSVSLALYFAERNKGQFKDHFITFSEKPHIQKVTGKTLQQKMNSIETADWDSNTDLEAVFDLLVDTAVKNNSSPDEMPSTIYIISDMEFDSCIGGGTNFEAIDKKYKKAGYKRPHVVFWNVDARQKNCPVEENQEGVTLVSGSSASTFKLVMEGKTPTDLMEDVINSDRYLKIEL